MEPFLVSFLGTGNAVPTKRRNHTAILIEYKDENILVDCGEGAQRQFAYAGKNPHKLTKILITHWHGDHILGLPGLIQTLALSGYQKVLHLYGPKGTTSWFERLKPFCGTTNINIQIHEIDEGIFFDKKEFYLQARRMDHGTPCLGYSVVIPDKLRLDSKKLKKLKLPNSPLIGELQAGKTINWKGKKITSKSVSYKEEGRKLTVILDTKYTEQAVQLAKDSDCLIIESSFSDKEKDKAAERLHLTAKEAATIAKRANAKKLALIHISQRYEHNPKIILDEAKKVFKNTFIPNDLDSLSL
jgi:ribonuclease Z